MDLAVYLAVSEGKLHGGQLPFIALLSETFSLGEFRHQRRDFSLARIDVFLENKIIFAKENLPWYSNYRMVACFVLSALLWLCNGVRSVFSSKFDNKTRLLFSNSSSSVCNEHRKKILPWCFFCLDLFGSRVWCTEYRNPCSRPMFPNPVNRDSLLQRYFQSHRSPNTRNTAVTTWVGEVSSILTP